MPTWCRVPARRRGPSSSEPTIVPGAVLVPAEAGDDTVGGALVLHLHHRRSPGDRARPAAWPRRRPARRPRSAEPVLGERAIARGRREVDRRPALASTRSSRSGARASGASRRSSSPSASRSQATNEAGNSPRASPPATRPDGCAGARPRSRARPGRRSRSRRRPRSARKRAAAAPQAPESSGPSASNRGSAAEVITVAEDERAKPSHLGSNSQPSPAGSALGELESMGRAAEQRAALMAVSSGRCARR